MRNDQKPKWPNFENANDVKMSIMKKCQNDNNIQYSYLKSQKCENAKM